MNSRKNPPIPNKSSKIVATATKEYYAGPLPPPESLQKYDDIMPGLANRIVAMAEREQESRIQSEKSIITLERNTRMLGLVFAFIVAMTALLGGIGLLYFNHKIGGLFSGVAIFWLVSAFIKGKKAVEKQEWTNITKQVIMINEN